MVSKIVKLCLYFAFTGLCQAAGVLAETHAAAVTPRVCIGYYGADAASWGNRERWGDCPKQHAVFGAANIFAYSSFAEGEFVHIGDVDCCPLPSGDVLLEEQVVTYDQCPDSFIVTSDSGIEELKLKSDPGSIKMKWPLRCTRVNTARYVLGEVTKGAHWGRGATDWKNSLRLFRSDMPMAIKIGIGRKSKYQWHFRGCIGQPAGSVLVGKKSKLCQGLLFRRILYRGMPGDPPAGTPVKMFPDCKSLPDPFEPGAGCAE